MKQAYDGSRNIAVDKDAQAQARAMIEKLAAGEKVAIDPGYQDQMRSEYLDKFRFETRRDALSKLAKGDANRFASFTVKAEELTSYAGYKEHLNSLTMMGEPKQATPEDWIIQRDQQREAADAAREDLYASSHAAEIMKWAEGQSEPLKTAAEAVRHQIADERQRLAQAAAEVQRLWIQSPSSPELLQAQEALANTSKKAGRLERSLALIEQGS